MNSGLSNSPLFEGIGKWLVDQGLREVSDADIVQGVGQRLVAGGIPLYRLSIGGMVLHPIFGAKDVVWDADNDHVRSQMMPREIMSSVEFQNSPFFMMATENRKFFRQRLDDNLGENEFPIFDQLRGNFVTDYFAFFKSYGRIKEVKWANLPPGMEGVIGSFSTRRIGGFTEQEIEYLEALSGPLSLAMKSATIIDLAHSLLDVYLGNHSGGQVLEGLVERGDGRIVNCVIFFCDLRNSTALADEMPLDEYLSLLNQYFDFTAGAVIEHGGEVLKFIGDAVMAIFPIEDETRPPLDMCRAAIMAAREALARAERGNAERLKERLSPIHFGMALHVGEVMYGNVGTRRRLDFTVTGPAVNEAARLEGLSKAVGTPVIISQDFRNIYPDGLISLGAHEVDGKSEPLEIFSLPDFVSEGPSTENVETLIPKSR